ncbi:MAG: ATP-grasp domain-containing protein [Planctomycetota bacterium]|nr:ATP-grasp domain-containing protein [Planctomycetota bacterium]
MSRVLLLLPTTSYRTDAFLEAAARLEIEVTVASEQPNSLAHLNPAALLTLDFANPRAAAERVCTFAKRYPIDAVVPVDSQVVAVGAAIAAALGLRHNSLEAALCAGDKYRSRLQFRQAGVAAPEFRLCSFAEDHSALAARVSFPCVVKPLRLSGSQGVIRADNPKQFVEAVDRLAAILACPEARGAEAEAVGCDAVAEPAPGRAQEFLVERFVAGPEVALEGLLTGGKLQMLALFDKPDPLDGPFFEETIYVTPSRLAAQRQQEIVCCAQQAAGALGLTEGPVHAELRLTADGPSVIEINPRSIGGLCSRVLRFGLQCALEDLILRHALNADFELPVLSRQPAGVMMIPIPRAGRLCEVHGLDLARGVAGIETVTLSAHPGQRLVPLPEGAQYLGFLFARAESSESVEAALRRAHDHLEFVIAADKL